MHLDPHTHREVYVCEGSCKAVISKAQYDAGKTQCGTESCSRFGQPFSPRIQCDNCGRMMTPEESERHHAKHG
jgi:hypothetical protein